MTLLLRSPRSTLCTVIFLASCASKPAQVDAGVALRDAGAGRATAVDASPREVLLPAARALLQARMRRHGTEMTQLLSAVVLLDWTEVERVSERLIEEPTPAPPLPGDQDSYNVELPAVFFVRQQALTDALRDLREAAQQQSDHALKVSFNGVASACFDCHAAYLSLPAQPDILREPGL